MSGVFFGLFDSPLGHCAVTWARSGVLGLALPAANTDDTREQVLRQFPTARLHPLDGEGRLLAEGVQALLNGEAVDLSGAALDMTRVSTFYRRVYIAARSVGVGETITYGALAKLIGAPGASRAVGQALGRNPFAVVVPCHRVLAASGRLGGFSAHGGPITKQWLLSIEQRAIDKSHVRPPLHETQPSAGLGS